MIVGEGVVDMPCFRVGSARVDRGGQGRAGGGECDPIL